MGIASIWFELPDLGASTVYIGRYNVAIRVCSNFRVDSFKDNVLMLLETRVYNNG